MKAQSPFLHHVPDPLEPLSNEFVPHKTWTNLPSAVYDRYNNQVPLDEDLKRDISLRDPGISRRVEERLIDELIEYGIFFLAAEEEEMENTAAELLSSPVAEILIDELISDMSLLARVSMDEEEEQVENRAELVAQDIELGLSLELDNVINEFISELMLEKSGTSTSPRPLRSAVAAARAMSSDEDDDTKESMTTPVKIGRMSGDTRSPSNESDTTEDVFLSPGSLDSSDGTVVSAFMMGEEHSGYCS